MLEGIRVISFTHYLQGPYCVQMLADLGADVIKVESPKGAFERHWSGMDIYLNNMSVFYLLGNRNQRSLSVDLKNSQGQELIYRLLETADILVENFRPGVMEKLGFGYEQLKKNYPKLIYCSCTGYGSGGPYKNRPGQDLIIQGMSGMASLGGVVGAPAAVGASVVDIHGAALASIGILAALVDRERTGRGHRVETNLLSAALDLQVEPFSYYLNSGKLYGKLPTGLSDRIHESPYGIYEASDGYLLLSATPLDKLQEVLDGEVLKGFEDRDRFTRREELDTVINREIQKKSVDEWCEIFERHQIWYSRISEYEDVEKNPQLVYNESVETFDHPYAGRIRMLRHPNRYDGENRTIQRYQPLQGEHSAEIMREAGYSEEEIARCFEQAVVFDEKREK